MQTRTVQQCIYLLLIVLSVTAYKQCIHDQIRQRHPVSNRVIGSGPAPRDVQQSTTFQPIRISVESDTLLTDANTCHSVGQRVTTDAGTTFTCTAAEVINAARKTQIEAIITRVTRRISQLLAVRPIAGQLSLVSSVTTCPSGWGATIASKYRSPNGIANTDLLIFLTARPENSGTIAYAISCGQIESLGRPVAGLVNMNPVNFLDDTQNDDNTRVDVLLHEIFHVLGFNSADFGRFVNANGVQLGAANVVSTTTKTFGGVSKTIYAIKTPTVISTAKAHLACNTVPGIPLEEFGGSGTAGSHWEMTQMYDDVMIGIAAHENPGDGHGRVSPITLGLFEDSGWYKANFSAAEPILWGRSMGCSFLDRCETWQNPQNLNGYFCTTGNQDGCNYNLMARAKCYVAQYNGALGYYAHLPNTQLGGPYNALDYCPIYISSKSCIVASQAPTDAGTRGESYSKDSRCFMGTAVIAGSTEQSQSRCYQTRCAGSNLQVKVGQDWYTCPENGGDITAITGFTGKITCPKSWVVCQSYTPPAIVAGLAPGTSAAALSTSPLSGIIVIVAAIISLLFV